MLPSLARGAVAFLRLRGAMSEGHISFLLFIAIGN